MKLTLLVTEGPYKGKEFVFEGHETFLVGREEGAHLQISADDPFFSRKHFMLEINPPRCRLTDFGSRNGTFLNGQKVDVADVKDGDTIKAGHTVFKIEVEKPESRQPATVELAGSGPYGTVLQRPNRDSTIRGYEIVKELGRGGMGVVYHALRISDGQPVALKKIIPATEVSKKHLERFIREASILGRLKHPNIIGFEQVGSEGEGIFLAMELVTGPDVATYLVEQGPLPIRKAVRMICQTLSGLQHAHDNGFVHRDIKPSNLLIHAEGGKKITKLADFGLARVYESSQLSGLTMQGEFGGSPAYIAPEQITHFRDVKPAADQYSAAATLYTLLTRKHVHDFPKGKVHEAILMISTHDPVPIRERRPDLPQGLAEVIHRALSREAKDRFGSAEEFKRALKAWA